MNFVGRSADSTAEGLVNSPKTVYIETYGCQMNVSDTEIVLSVLQSAGYEHVYDMNEADVILTNTCAIRENAESKVWQRLAVFKKLKASKKQKPVVGVLGCMAERLKSRLLGELPLSVILVQRLTQLFQWYIPHLLPNRV